MQIGGLPITLPQSLPTQRQDSVERVQRDDQRDQSRREGDREQVLIPRENSLPADVNVRSINATSGSSEAGQRPRFDDQQLPLNVQRALNTFEQNTPSPEQRLGIELAGIDTFA